MNRPYAAASSSLRNSTGTARHGTADQPRGRRSPLYRDFSFQCSSRAGPEAEPAPPVLLAPVAPATMDAAITAQSAVHDLVKPGDADLADSECRNVEIQPTRTN